MFAAERRERRTWSAVPDGTSLDGNLGDTQLRSSPGPTALGEQRIAARLTKAGLDVQQNVQVLVPDLLRQEGATWWCTPDLVIGDVCVEIDHPSEKGGGPSHHEGFPAEDLYRTDCLLAAGKRVIRARMGGLRPVDGAFNILSPGSALVPVTDAITTLLPGINAGRAPTDTQLRPPKKRAPSKSPMSSIREDRYVNYGHYFTWGKGDDKVFYRLHANGRFLYVDSSCVSGEIHNPGYAGARTAFLQEVDLHEQPRESWRDTLEPIVKQHYLKDPTRTYTVTPFGGDIGTLKTDRSDLHLEFSSGSRDWSFDIIVWIKTDDGFANKAVSWRHDVGIIELQITTVGGDPIGHVSFNDALNRFGYQVAAANPVRDGYRLELVAQPASTLTTVDGVGTSEQIAS